ncbi:MAG: nucleoside-triphosphatase [bacterium]
MFENTATGISRIAERIRSSPGQNWLLTGVVNSGKSFCLKYLVNMLNRDDATPYAGGLISEAVYLKDEKAGYRGINMITGDTLPLALREDLGPDMALGVFGVPPDVYETSGKDLIVGRWRVFSSGLKGGIDALFDAVSAGCALVVLDEFGPLEISGDGFRHAVDSLFIRNIPFLLVVRLSLVDQVMKVYPSIAVLHTCP